MKRMLGNHYHWAATLCSKVFFFSTEFTVNPMCLTNCYIILMPNLDCELDYIQNQLKPKQLGTTLIDFTWLNHSWWEDWILIIWGQKVHPYSGPYFLVASRIRGHGRKKLLSFSCLLLSAQLHLPGCQDFTSLLMLLVLESTSLKHKLSRQPGC